MHKPVYLFTNGFICLLLILIFSNCNTTAQRTSPAGYDFTTPQKKLLPAALHEISGIAFLKEKEDSLFAIEDEDGKIFSFSWKDESLSRSKFGKKGDYEDVTIFDSSRVAVLRSDGSLFLFSVEAMKKEKMDSVQIYEHILPEGEYEGLFADSNKLFALCKNCPGDKQKKEVSVYTLQKTAGDSFSVAGSFKIDVSIIQPKDGNDKAKFHPSGIAKHPLTHEWFIISSVNKLLLILNEQWKVKKYYPLDPALFKQPEGITFNSKGDLYISNEGGEGDANILLFRYQK